MVRTDRVLREMLLDDVEAVLDVQQPAAVVGLADVFPQDRFPFPRVSIAQRWRAELEDPAISCFVILLDEAVAGFAALRDDEVLHFGVALETWGSGLAVAAHAELLSHLAVVHDARPWLRVYSQNARGRAFWEKLGWEPTGELSRGAAPPHAELTTYELRRELGRNRGWPDDRPVGSA